MGRAPPLPHQVIRCFLVDLLSLVHRLFNAVFFNQMIMINVTCHSHTFATILLIIITIITIIIITRRIFAFTRALSWRERLFLFHVQAENIFVM